MKCLIVVEKTQTGYSAYAPDYPGCIATGRTKTEVKIKMKQALEFHITGSREAGMLDTPQKSSTAYVTL